MLDFTYRKFAETAPVGATSAVHWRTVRMNALKEHAILGGKLGDLNLKHQSMRSLERTGFVQFAREQRVPPPVCHLFANRCYPNLNDFIL